MCKGAFALQPVWGLMTCGSWECQVWEVPRSVGVWDMLGGVLAQGRGHMGTDTTPLGHAGVLPLAPRAPRVSSRRRRLTPVPPPPPPTLRKSRTPSPASHALFLLPHPQGTSALWQSSCLGLPNALNL